LRGSAINKKKLEYARYERQIGLPEVGREGQEKLFATRALVVGAGGLGSPILYYLAAAGVGTIGILDHDEVSASNLNRQILYGAGDIGRPKTEAAREKLRAFNPAVAIQTHRIAMDSGNAGEIVAGYDVVLAAVDSLESRLIINQACFQAGVPWINGGVDRYAGMVSVYAPPKGPCYRCLTQGGSKENQPIPLLMGALAGTIGLLQTQEALKLILKIGTPLVGRILFYDALEPRFDIVDVTPDPDCPVCGGC